MSGVSLLDELKELRAKVAEYERQPTVPQVVAQVQPLMAGAIYNSGQLMQALGIGRDTLTYWLTIGLKYIPGARRRGRKTSARTKSDMFFAEDVIDFLRGLRVEGNSDANS